MKPVLKWTLLFFIIISSIFSFALYQNTKSDIGFIHPMFAFIKLITPENSDQQFIDALKSQDKEDLIKYRSTVAEFYKLSGDVVFDGSITEGSYNSSGHDLGLKVYTPYNRSTSNTGELSTIVYFWRGIFIWQH